MNVVPLITGLGLVTPLAKGVEQNWQALVAGEFIRDHSRVPGLDQSSPRILQLALSASREAITSARWTDQLLGDASTALVIGTSKGPIETWLAAPPGHIVDKPYIVAGELDGFGLAQLGDWLSRDLKFGAGPCATISAACATGIHALIHGCVLLKSGIAARVLVVAAEASVHPLFVNSFKRLGVLAPEGAGCRPMDCQRNGFLMSEAAAAVCLETDASRAWHLSDKPSQATCVERFSLGADATHLTGVDTQGKALKHLVQSVVASQPVDLIHAHATGTELNDPIELAAIESAIADSDPAPNLFSHKGAFGHSLGAAGLVSVVLNCIAHRKGLVPPNVQTTQPLPSRVVRIAREPVERPIRRSVALAAGFGGAMAAISLRTP